MRNSIKKILKESEEWFDELDLQSNLPFEISQNPRNRPKITNMLIMKTGWDDGDRYLREDFSFKIIIICLIFIHTNIFFIFLILIIMMQRRIFT